jgi:hypothetical protein
MERRIDAAEAPQDSVEREAFFEWLDDVATQNAAQNIKLSEDEVLAIIEEARGEAAAESGKDRIPR